MLFGIAPDCGDIASHHPSGKAAIIFDANAAVGLGTIRPLCGVKILPLGRVVEEDAFPVRKGEFHFAHRVQAVRLLAKDHLDGARRNAFPVDR